MKLIEEVRKKLTEKGLRITPQRLSILESIVRLNNHPTADEILTYIKKNHPNIATGTVYKVLDSLVVNGLVTRVKTDTGIMRYDAVIEKHHHLYCSDSDKIQDYYNDEVFGLLNNYFELHEIPGFKIEDIKLQIIGKFKSINT